MISLAVMANILMLAGMLIIVGAVYFAMFKKGAKINENSFMRLLASGLLSSVLGIGFTFFAERAPITRILTVGGIIIVTGFVGFCIFHFSFWFLKRRIMRDIK